MEELTYDVEEGNVSHLRAPLQHHCWSLSPTPAVLLLHLTPLPYRFFVRCFKLAILHLLHRILAARANY